MASKLRVGVVGTGFGRQVQIPAFRAHPRVELVAVAGSSLEKARAVADRFGIPHAFGDAAALARMDLDLVGIATPPRLHLSETLAALAAGRQSSVRSPWPSRPPRQSRCCVKRRRDGAST